MGSKIAFVDTETTSLDVRHGELWELAIELYETEEGGLRLERHVASEHIFVRPKDMFLADPGSMRMNKFYERTSGKDFRFDVDHRVPEDMGVSERDDINFEIANRVARMLHGALVCGMNVPFDMGFIDKFLLDYGQSRATWDYHPGELETLMLGALAARGEKVGLPWKSDNLSKAIGVNPPDKSQRHTAVADAQWCVDVWSAITDPDGEGRLLTEPDIPDWANPEDPDGEEG